MERRIAMRFSWKSLALPVALLAAGAVGFGIARFATAAIPDVVAIYEGKLSYKFYPLADPSEETARKGSYPATLFLDQEGNSIGGAIFVGDEEETIFEVQGEIGPDGRFYLYSLSENGLVLVTGRAKGQEPNRKFIFDGAFCGNLALNEIKFVMKENPEATF
jgi:hypothetical protein